VPAGSPASTDICLSHYSRTKLCFVAAIFGTKLPRVHSFHCWRRMLPKELLPKRVWVTGRSVLELADLGCFGINEMATFNFRFEKK
jgi:hypothetical protein